MTEGGLSLPSVGDEADLRRRRPVKVKAVAR